jgi:hypothetical protein
MLVLAVSAGAPAGAAAATGGTGAEGGKGVGGPTGAGGPTGVGGGAGGIVVSVDASRPGAVIAPGFLGLSLETPALGVPAITSTAPALVALMRQLGPGLLRISGVSADRTQWLGVGEAPAPWRIATVSVTDLANLAALMRASGWRLLLGLNLGHQLPGALVEEARAAGAALGSSLAGLELGNEPDLYTRPSSAPFRALLGRIPLRPPGWGEGEYEAEISSLRAALAAAGVTAPLYGPDTAAPAWLEGYARQQRAGLAALAEHAYPLNRCHKGRLLKRGPSIHSLLSPRIARREARLVAALMRVAAASGLPLRIDEANSVACAGQPHTSDTFAAALWAVDFALIAAQRGVAGVNFHGGLGSCAAGGTIISPWYSPLCTLPDGQLHARPEYYALLLLSSLEGATFVQASYATPHHLAVFALRAPDGSLRVVIDDMEAPGTERARNGAPRPVPLRIALRVDQGLGRGSVVRLTAPSAAASDRTTLGKSTVGADGSFAVPVPEALDGERGSFQLTVAPASVALVTLSAGAPVARAAARG